MEQNFESNIVCGLGNLGNTCFANSALQALTASQPFIAALRYGVADDVSPPPASSASSPTSPPPAHAADFSATSAAATAFERFKFLTRYSTARHEVRKELIRTANAMQFGSDLVIAPRGMIRNVAAINEQFAVLGQQQDAAEWLHSVVDSVDECCSVDGQARETLSSLEASSVPSSSALPDPRLWLWRALASIDEENEELDRIEKERKHRDDRVGPASPWIAPRHHRGPIGDVFRGLYVSSIECLTCHRASRVATEFTALELAIPPDEARKQYADLMALNPPASSGSRPQSPVTEPKSKSRAVSLNPIVAARAAIGGCLSVVARSMRWLWCCVGGGCCQDFPPLTLEELLWFHCRPEDLTGSNKYHCSYCGGKPRDAVKTIKFLALPETLVVHIKRFEVGSYWTSKLRDHVRFPLDFVPAAAADGASAAVVTSDGETPPLDMKSVLYHGGPLVTSYTLNAVVNHHGSFMGGHYTAYSLRGGNWVLHNDAKAMRVDAKVVADSQAYVLVYQRQALTVNDAASVVPPQHRLAAQRYLHHGYSAQASTTDSQDSVLVSRMWLLRLATFAEPGPITNSMCYCPASRRQNHCTVFGGDVSDALMPPVEHGDRSNRHFHCPAEWFYTRVSAADFDAWQRHYGGGPRVDDRAYLQCWQHETRWIGAIQRALQLGHRGSS